MLTCLQANNLRSLQLPAAACISSNREAERDAKVLITIALIPPAWRSTPPTASYGSEREPLQGRQGAGVQFRGDPSQMHPRKLRTKTRAAATACTRAHLPRCSPRTAPTSCSGVYGFWKKILPGTGLGWIIE